MEVSRNSIKKVETFIVSQRAVLKDTIANASKLRSVISFDNFVDDVLAMLKRAEVHFHRKNVDLLDVKQEEGQHKLESARSSTRSEITACPSKGYIHVSEIPRKIESADWHLHPIKLDFPDAQQEEIRQEFKSDRGSTKSAKAEWPSKSYIKASKTSRENKSLEQSKNKVKNDIKDVIAEPKFECNYDFEEYSSEEDEIKDNRGRRKNKNRLKDRLFNFKIKINEKLDKLASLGVDEILGQILKIPSASDIKHSDAIIDIIITRSQSPGENPSNKFLSLFIKAMYNSSRMPDIKERIVHKIKHETEMVFNRGENTNDNTIKQHFRNHFFFVACITSELVIKPRYLMNCLIKILNHPDEFNLGCCLTIMYMSGPSLKKECPEGMTCLYKELNCIYKERARTLNEPLKSILIKALQHQ